LSIEKIAQFGTASPDCENTPLAPVARMRTQDFKVYQYVKSKSKVNPS
jgi:hypothetical protein